MEHKQFGRIGELLGEIEQIIEEGVSVNARTKGIKCVRELEKEFALLKEAVVRGAFKAAKAILISK